MLSVEEAKSILAQLPVSVKPTLLPLSAALGCVLAEDIEAPVAVPTFDNAAMDGYAIALLPQQTHFPILGEVKAGDPIPPPITPGAAYRIFTGAPIPPGTDMVIQQELVQVEANQLYLAPEDTIVGKNIRRKGSQHQIGDSVATAGTVLSPGAIGLLASLGIQQVKVAIRPTIAVIVTGDELVAPGKTLEDGKIYESNSSLVTALLQAWHLEVQQVSYVKDEANAVHTAIEEALSTADCVILTGGISVGDYDHVATALAHHQVEPLFYKLKQKPGKPVFVGKKNQQLVFALPGNPAAVLTCMRLYVVTTLRHRMGVPQAFQPDAVVPAILPYEKPTTLTHWLKARLDYKGLVWSGGQESYHLGAMYATNALAEIDASVRQLLPGTPVPVYFLNPTA